MTLPYPCCHQRTATPCLPKRQGGWRYLLPTLGLGLAVAGLPQLALAAPYTAGTTTDRYGAVTGHMESNGTTTDRYGAVTGHVESDGTLTDRYGAVKGHIGQDGAITDTYGATMGHMTSDGELDDRYGEPVGNLRSDGTVVNKTGAVVGHVPPGDKVGAIMILRDGLSSR
ncbi:hypothetical protein E3E12_07750 [Formicincola oecophyllae]|uniref:Uncharacterized protein n=1 Tax=Formicincola oecophyllae TaxID=2558361 RepID=A0A4Y6U9F0_9PROT|nr:hypothetical protein [Formicincola oecophyllae]QDH14089.1 hypothetical protein E3E12_07750 [Formicincola oecophyllae]